MTTLQRLAVEPIAIDAAGMSYRGQTYLQVAKLGVASATILAAVQAYLKGMGRRRGRGSARPAADARRGPGDGVPGGADRGRGGARRDRYVGAGRLSHARRLDRPRRRPEHERAGRRRPRRRPRGAGPLRGVAHDRRRDPRCPAPRQGGDRRRADRRGRGRRRRRDRPGRRSRADRLAAAIPPSRPSLPGGLPFPPSARRAARSMPP